jgi:hypothetical protein
MGTSAVAYRIEIYSIIKGHNLSWVNTNCLGYNLVGQEFRNKNVIFFSDNEAVVSILNSKTSKSKTVMSLLRFIIYCTLKFNIQLKSNIFHHKITKLLILFLVGRSNDSGSWCHLSSFTHVKFLQNSGAFCTRCKRNVWCIPSTKHLEILWEWTEII